MQIFRTVFILDTGAALYVWVGRGATQQEKSQSIVHAQSELSKLIVSFMFKFGNFRFFQFNQIRFHQFKEISVMDTSASHY